MSKKNSKKNNKINLELKNIPHLETKKNFKNVESYLKFFDEIIPKIEYLLALSTYEITDDTNKLLKLYIKYYITVFYNLIKIYSYKPSKKILNTYSKVCYYTIHHKLSFINKILTDFYDSDAVKINKIDASTITGNILKPCKPGYIRDSITNRCSKKKENVKTIYYGPFETPKGMKKGSKKDAIKSNQVCRYGIEKLTNSEVIELNKLHNNKK